METILGIFPQLLVSLLGVALGWFWARWKSAKDWEKKQFHSTIVISLNVIEPPVKKEYMASLKLRTLTECQISEIFPLIAMQQIIKRGIQTTTSENPLMEFSPQDSWHILNTTLNYISRFFVQALFRKDMGGSVLSEPYLFCFTYERAGEVRTQKPRIMLFRKKSFLEFPMEGEIELEDPNFHITRVQTIRKLRKLYEEKKHLFREMEIVV